MASTQNGAGRSEDEGGAAMTPDPAAQVAFEVWLAEYAPTMTPYAIEIDDLEAAFLTAWRTARQQQVEAITQAVRNAVVQEYPGSDSSLERILAAITRAAEGER